MSGIRKNEGYARWSEAMSIKPHRSVVPAQTKPQEPTAKNDLCALIVCVLVCPRKSRGQTGEL